MIQLSQKGSSLADKLLIHPDSPMVVDTELLIQQLLTELLTHRVGSVAVDTELLTHRVSPVVVDTKLLTHRVSPVVVDTRLLDSPCQSSGR